MKLSTMLDTIHGWIESDCDEDWVHTINDLLDNDHIEFCMLVQFVVANFLMIDQISKSLLLRGLDMYSATS